MSGTTPASLSGSSDICNLFSYSKKSIKEDGFSELKININNLENSVSEYSETIVYYTFEMRLKCVRIRMGKMNK